MHFTQTSLEHYSPGSIICHSECLSVDSAEVTPACDFCHAILLRGHCDGDWLSSHPSFWAHSQPSCYEVTTVSSGEGLSSSGNSIGRMRPAIFRLAHQTIPHVVIFGTVVCGTSETSGCVDLTEIWTWEPMTETREWEKSQEQTHKDH
jgi:hypothetical protein